MTASTTREFAWTTDDFKRVKALIYKKAGINLHDGKEAMVYSRVVRRVREHNVSSFTEYLDRLEQLDDDHEWQLFINVLTTNLTSFYREPHHFSELTQIVQTKPQHPWKIWCCAASTGEEPYSITMTMLEALGPQIPFTLLATDIDTNVLATASTGVYAADNMPNVPVEQLQKYCLRGKGAQDGKIGFKPLVKSRIHFEAFNLIAEPWSQDQKFDIIFCRNVMIYFDHVTQRNILKHMHRCMNQGAQLFVGHSENFTDMKQLFSFKGKTRYEKV